MPLSRYNRQFGGEEGSAAKAHSSMIQQYGEDKGESVFYATVNKRKKQARNRAQRRAVSSA